MGKNGLLEGIELFNRGDYFDCHEVIESEWVEEKGPRRWFLQAIIHLAVGLYHHEQNNPDGCERQFRKGLKKLAGYLPDYEGIDTIGLYRSAIRWRESGGAAPVIAFLEQKPRRA